MKGIVFLGNKKLEIQNFEDPTPGPDEVILEIQASGMCGSDLKFYRANGGPSSLGLGGDDKPVIAGHEPCGTIVEIGSNVPKNLVLKACVLCNITIKVVVLAYIVQQVGNNYVMMVSKLFLESLATELTLNI